MDYFWGGTLVGVLLWWGLSFYLDRINRNIYLAWIPIFLIAIIFIGHTYYLNNYPSNTVGSVPPDFIINPPAYPTKLEEWKNNFLNAHPFMNVFLSSPFGIGVLFGPPVKGLVQLVISKI